MQIATISTIKVAKITIIERTGVILIVPVAFKVVVVPKMAIPERRAE